MTSILFRTTSLCFYLILLATVSRAQSIPEERRITHREQSLMIYEPFKAEEIWKRIQVPPSPPLTPEQALESFQVAAGFRIECVAAEPLIEDPVQFEFDPDGRIWAVEMRGYMRDIEGRDENASIGRVVVLEDTDGDTFMDKSTVFLDGLVMARTLQFVQGGVLVQEPPNLWFCQDTNGDLICDRKRLVIEIDPPSTYSSVGQPRYGLVGDRRCAHQPAHCGRSVRVSRRTRTNRNR